MACGGTSCESAGRAGCDAAKNTGAQRPGFTVSNCQYKCCSGNLCNDKSLYASSGECSVAHFSAIISPFLLRKEPQEPSYGFAANSIRRQIATPRFFFFWGGGGRVGGRRDEAFMVWKFHNCGEHAVTNAGWVVKNGNYPLQVNVYSQVWSNANRTSLRWCDRASPPPPPPTVLRTSWARARYQATVTLFMKYPEYHDAKS